MAGRLGLKKALPEEKLRIQLAPSGDSVTQTLGSGIPMSSAKKTGDGNHD
jgi:hypothetical protein